jgi:predicted XRE-type DNA-binding protein
VDLDTLRGLARADDRAQARRDETHRALVEAIWEAADQGMPQVEIVRAVGITRERVRQLCSPDYRERHRANKT